MAKQNGAALVQTQLLLVGMSDKHPSRRSVVTAEFGPGPPNFPGGFVTQRKQLRRPLAPGDRIARMQPRQQEVPQFATCFLYR
jgi:hypothetical protein